jgi:hypothetical protein
MRRDSCREFQHPCPELGFRRSRYIYGPIKDGDYGCGQSIGEIDQGDLIRSGPHDWEPDSIVSVPLRPGWQEL